MSTPMADLLDKLIAESPDGFVQLQVCFKPGVTTNAGLLRKGPVDGTYCLGTGTRATADTPGGFRAGEAVMVEMLFEAEAVQTVVRMGQQQQPSIISPGQALA